MGILDYLVNTDHSFITHNWFDDGRRYFFRIVNGELFYRRDGDTELKISLPVENSRIIKASADNNRILVLVRLNETDELRLFWCCIISDKAKWVQYIFKIADILSSTNFLLDEHDKDKKEIDGLFNFLYSNLESIRDCLFYGLESAKDFIDLGIDLGTKRDTIGQQVAQIISLDNSDPEKRILLQVLLNDLFTLFLSPNYQGAMSVEDVLCKDFDTWATAYRNWVNHAHEPFHWNEIKRTTIKVKNPQKFCPQKKMSSDENQAIENAALTLKFENIVDIAVGNWHQTVVTFYLLVKFEASQYSQLFGADEHCTCDPCILLYIDEEPMMPNWKIVPGVIGTPYPFTPNATITASQSVIAVLERSAKLNTLHWVRFDYHNFEDFAWFPLNWTEYYFGQEFDVDTIRLRLTGQDRRSSRNFVIGLFKSFISYVIKKTMGQSPDFPKEMMTSFKETTDNHPGWHQASISSDTISGYFVDTAPEGPWPVPSVNSFMYDMLIFSRIIPTFGTGGKNVAKWVDSIFELLHKLYSGANEKTRQFNKVSAILENIGFLGENPLIPSFNYPFHCILKEGKDTYHFFTHSRSADTTPLQWSAFKRELKCYLITRYNTKVRISDDNTVVKHCAVNGAVLPLMITYQGRKKIAVQDLKGTWLSAIDGGGSELVTGSCRIGRWEEFLLVPSTVVLVSEDGNLISYDASCRVWAREPLESNRSVFKISDEKNGLKSFRSLGNRRYLSIKNDSGELFVNSFSASSGERFKLIPLGIDVYAIASEEGLYLTVTSRGRVGATTRDIIRASAFEMKIVSFGLRAQSGAYIRNSPDGSVDVRGSRLDKSTSYSIVPCFDSNNDTCKSFINSF